MVGDLQTAALIGRDGSVVARFSPQTEPESDDVVSAVEGALA